MGLVHKKPTVMHEIHGFAENIQGLSPINPPLAPSVIGVTNWADITSVYFVAISISKYFTQ